MVISKEFKGVTNSFDKPHFIHSSFCRVQYPSYFIQKSMCTLKMMRRGYFTIWTDEAFESRSLAYKYAYLVKSTLIRNLGLSFDQDKSLLIKKFLSTPDVFGVVEFPTFTIDPNELSLDEVSELGFFNLSFLTMGGEVSSLWLIPQWLYHWLPDNFNFHTLENLRVVTYTSKSLLIPTETVGSFLSYGILINSKKLDI